MPKISNTQESQIYKKKQTKQPSADNKPTEITKHQQRAKGENEEVERGRLRKEGDKGMKKYNPK